MNKKIYELIEIVNKNPDLSVLFYAHHEVVLEDNGYWKCEIESIEIEPVLDNPDIDDERFYIGYDNIIEKLKECYESENDDFINKKYDELNLKKYIIVKLSV